MGKKSQHAALLLLLLCLSGLVRCSAALLFWTAMLEMSYVNSNNKTVERYCECGVYGRNSPLDKVVGVVTLPAGDPEGCGPDPVYGRNSSSPPWIALVKRGECIFSDKINAAQRQGAAGVVVYNEDGSGNRTMHMIHSGTGDTVAIMIGNIQGTEIADLLRNGTHVHMVIDVGNPHGPWMDTYWLYFLSIAFFIVTAASVVYFVFISARRLHGLRLQRRMKSEAKRALGRLRVRTLRHDDEETASDSHMCAVCIESYRPGDVVTVLTCEHVFHKACIEPWLLDRRTCPMCKCDVMKALGVQEEPGDAESPTEVAVITVAGGEALYEVPLTEPATPDPETHQHRYDNRAFLGDSQELRG